MRLSRLLGEGGGDGVHRREPPSLHGHREGVGRVQGNGGAGKPGDAERGKGLGVKFTRVQSRGRKTGPKAKGSLGLRRKKRLSQALGSLPYGHDVLSFRQTSKGVATAPVHKQRDRGWGTGRPARGPSREQPGQAPNRACQPPVPGLSQHNCLRRSSVYLHPAVSWGPLVLSGLSTVPQACPSPPRSHPSGPSVSWAEAGTAARATPPPRCRLCVGSGSPPTDPAVLPPGPARVHRRGKRAAFPGTSGGQVPGPSPQGPVPPLGQQ